MFSGLFFHFLFLVRPRSPRIFWSHRIPVLGWVPLCAPRFVLLGSHCVKRLFSAVLGSSNDYFWFTSYFLSETNDPGWSQDFLLPLDPSTGVGPTARASFCPPGSHYVKYYMLNSVSHCVERSGIWVPLRESSFLIEVLADTPSQNSVE